MIRKICTLAACLALAAPVTHAQEYMFTYSKLFSQLKHNNEEQFTDVKVAIFFNDAEYKTQCKIHKAWMEKEEHYEELQVSDIQEVIVPIDGNLKSANPLVFIQTPQNRRCDYSVVVMGKTQLEGKVSYSQLAPMLPQMQEMLETLGGMFASFFTPKVEGLTLEFTEQEGDILLSNGKTVQIDKGRARVLLADIAPDGYLELPYKTKRVLPWLPSAK
ncbi:DUF2987 domain-containing protein [Vibrio hannami]|uniref:DUF2987 domain-containing protein n=1 Tax=Vibrio hannami TaxID=2717094 RepID=UPI00240F9C0B|nr:DUF2987 domain-containing protein [Vibrio hannami]MDG3088144.1 DUF2987 domain-containing protein [Vibrio hannami]